MAEGSVALILNKNDMWKFGTLSVSPFDWLEASYFYYRPSDLIWEGDRIRGHYLDKGFNIKFTYKSKNNTMPNIAIGLDDFAGTGYFTREYIVSTFNNNNLKSTIGLGWGKFANKNSLKNPLSSISESLSIRPGSSDNYKMGGSLSYDQWFRGNASIFGGFQYNIPKSRGLKFKIEYDPLDYLDLSARNRPDADFGLRKKDSNINFGFSFPYNKFLTIDASYIKGNTFNLNFTVGLTFNEDSSKKPKFSPEFIKNENTKTQDKNIFYEELLYNLNKNKLLLQTSNLSKKGNLNISISTSEHRNAIRSSSYAAYISKKVADKNKIVLTSIKVSHINAGVELNNINYIASHFDDSINTPVELKIRNTKIDSGYPNGYLSNEFQPNVNFPVIFSSTSPALITHIGNPEKFYLGGLNIQNISEIQFNRNLLLSTELLLPVYNNIRDTVSGSASSMEHVRTDLVQYLKEDDIHIGRMQLDYIWSPYKNVYSKLSAGIFEQMYAGIGGEVLYKPLDRNFSIGFELFHVQQRAFNQRFDFKEYNTTTGHLNVSYKFLAGIESNLSYGRYLAKDDGFTFDLSRRTQSGFKSGIYFTRTNVSAELFGEGSFDKGFYFQIPMDLLLNTYKGNYSSFKLSPLTRDGGAKLLHGKDLKGMIYNSTLLEINSQWQGFLN